MPLNIFHRLSRDTLALLQIYGRFPSSGRTTPISLWTSLFDSEYYLRANPDVAARKWNPRLHYLLFGAREGRDPSPRFSTGVYLRAYPDVASFGLNPLLHYVLYGSREGRAISASHPSSVYRATGVKSGNTIAIGRHATRVTKPDHPGLRSIPIPDQARIDLLTSLHELNDALSNTTAIVSIIIPCYNYGRYLWDAVSSALIQSYPHVEVIVVDDGSTDRDTLDLLETLRRKRVIVIHQSNQGLSQTRNNGAAIASGEYLLFLDADDRLDRNAIALLLHTLLCDPSTGYAYSCQRFFGDETLIWETQEYNAFDILWSNHPTVTALIRRSVFERVAGYRPEMLYGYEDWDLWVRLAAIGVHGRRVPAPAFEYRRHGVSMTHSAHERKHFLVSQLLAATSSQYQPHAITEAKRSWRPLISVIIPFYDSPRYLKDTLDSLRRQTTADFDLLIVDDGSANADSLQLLQEIDSSGFARVLHCPHAGLPAARNAGALAARAEWIMFLDSDDLLDPGALEKLCWTIAAHPDVAFVYSGVVHFGDIDAVCYEDFDSQRLQKENYLAATCVLSRKVYLALGGNDPQLTASWEDYDFWLRLVAHGHTGRLFREPLFLYRRHQEGKSRRLVAGQDLDAQAISEMVRSRHKMRTGGGPMPLRDKHPERDELAIKVSHAMSAVIPDEVPRRSYRRPNLPNLFSSERWDGRRTTVLYLIPWFQVGGAEVFDLRILDCLPRDRFYVLVVGCEHDDGPWYGKFKAAADEIYSSQRMGSDPATRAAFLRYLMISKSVDIVFNRNTMEGYDLAQAWPEVSAQVRYVDLLHLYTADTDWVHRSAPFDTRLDLRYVISDDLKQHTISKYGLAPDHFRTLYFGIDLAEVPNENECRTRRAALRHSLDIPPDALVVGFIGRLTQQKDPLRWLSVAAKIAERDQNAVFLIVGDGELMRQCRERAAVLRMDQRTRFVGYQGSAADYASAMDVLLMTSQYEGLPLVILEALVRGTPVVSTDVGGIRECVTPERGCLLPISEADERYAGAVLEMARLRVDSTAAAARIRAGVLSQFSRERMSAQLISDFTCLAGQMDRRQRLKDYVLDVMLRPILG